MNFRIPFGKQLISLSIPDSNIINFKCRDNKGLGLKEEQDLIIDALRNPVSSQNLADLAYRKKMFVYSFLISQDPVHLINFYPIL